MKEGLFITLEGGEGTGKTTLGMKLKEALSERGYNVILTREPGGTKLGDKIRQLILNSESNVSICNFSELLLFLAARAQHVAELIKPSLKAGKIVICDRFNDSTIAYQGVARGLGYHTIEQQCLFACQGVIPQTTLFLDLDPKIGLARTRKICKDSAKDGSVDRIESEELAFHASVRQGMLEIVARNPQRVHRIDASESLDQVFQTGLKIILNSLIA